MSDTPPIPPTATQPEKRRWRMTRRGFLIGATITTATLAFGLSAGIPTLHLRMAEMLDEGGQPSNFTTDPWAWFEITPDNQVKLFLGKAEMGQGVHTALAQIAVEELGVAWGELEVHQATTALGPEDANGTSGSSSVSGVYTPLRQAAAALRTMLQTEAAARLQIALTDLRLADKAFHAPGGASITFAELVRSKTDWEVPAEDVPLKDFRDFQVIGQPLPRVDIPAKVTGETIYGYDVKLPGMKFGAVLRPPTLEGKLLSANTDAAAALPGVQQVVVEDGFIGVVADSRAQAHAAVAAIQAEWEPGKLWQQADIDRIVTAGGSGGIVIQRAGNAPDLLDISSTLVAEYRTPFAVQTPLEAQAAAAQVEGDKLRIWVSTQMHARVRDVVAEALKLDAANVEIIPTYLGGGFGRKSGFDVAVEAAKLARATNVPVHVGWTRTEELRYGYLRPPTHHRLRGLLDDRGRIEALEHHQASGDVAFNFLPGFLKAIMGADFGATRGARLHYAIPHLHTVAWRRPVPVQTGWWRGLGLLANTFAVESFMDELAHAAGVDPLQFRLNHLADSPNGRRMAAVLEAAAEKAGWGGTLPEGRALGIACCTDVDTTVAEIAEVSLDAATGQLRVHQITAAMDCGLVINPDGAAAQIEGNIMWGVGSTLLEEAQVAEGALALDNFNTYPLLTMHQAPHVETVLLEAGDGKPRGVGEPPIGPVAAAISNALFALTGKRLRQLPMTPERVQSV